mgnify:FL=1|jgi:hypothetical protein
MNKAKMKEIRYDVMLSLYHDLPKEQYMQFEGLHLLKESLHGKTYKAIWAMPDGSRTACIILDDYTIPNYPVRIEVTGMTGFAA